MDRLPRTPPDRSAESSGPKDANTQQTSGQANKVTSQSWRLRAVVLFLGALALLLILRLIDMQIRSWQAYEPPQRVRSANNTVDDDTPWGVIVDRDGVLLAADRYVYRITATPNLIPQENWNAIADLLQTVAGVPVHETYETLAQSAQHSYAVLATNVNFQAGRTLLREQERRAAEGDGLLSHIYIQARPRRFYPQGELASQVIGLVNAERRPLLGVERYYHSFLPTTGVGLPRSGRESRDIFPPEVMRFLPQGQDKGLILTIDRTIQWIIEEELRSGLEIYGAEAGTIIVMNPKTGAILGMANAPSFDANRYESEDPGTFTNAAVSAQYEPGSIFKVITVAAALDTGAVEPTTIFTDTGTIVIGERTIQNSNRVALGRLSVADALAQSNNVVTVQIAEELGAERFYDYVALFGFGADTNIDVSGEIPGQVKVPGDGRWSLSDLGTNSFGQGIAVTPIQMISAVAAIANEGRLMRPHVVKARVHGDEVSLTQPTTVRQAISEETARTMRELMVHTIETGNQLARVKGYTVGGKSGTAEIATEGGYFLDETIVSFVGFAPADDPQFVVLVRLDRPDPTISRWAARTAAPIFSRITYRLLDHLNVPPDEIRLAQGAIDD